MTVKARTCGLCGFPIGEQCDGSEASHDGDGFEPCQYGHYGCSMSGRTGGPCRSELTAWAAAHPDACFRTGCDNRAWSNGFCGPDQPDPRSYH